MSLTHIQIMNLEFFPLIRYQYPPKTKDGFPILLETSAISPDVFNLLTPAPTNCLPFQNQIANDADELAGNPVLCLQL